MEERILTLESNCSQVAKNLESLHKIIEEVTKSIDNNFSAIGMEFKKLDAKVDSINNKLKNLAGDTSQNFDDVNLHLKNISEERIKINTVTNYVHQVDSQHKFTSH